MARLGITHSKMVERSDRQASVSKQSAIQKLLLGLAMSLALFSTSTAQALAQNLDELGDAILARQIELETLNEMAHLEVSRPLIGREKRIWLYDFLNAIPTEGGLLSAVAVYYAHGNNKIDTTQFGGSQNGSRIFAKSLGNKPSGQAISATLIPQIVGQGFGGGGALFELGIRLRHSRNIHKMLLDRKSISEKARQINFETTKLENQYEALLSASSNPLFYRMELELLRSLHAHSLLRYRYVQNDSLATVAGNTVEDSTAVFRNVVGAIGNSLNTAAVLNNNRRLNGQGSILNLIAASVISVRPALTNFSAFSARRYSDKLCRRAIPELKSIQTSNQDAQFQTTFQDLKLAATNSLSARAQKRVSIYELAATNIAEEESLKEIEQRNRSKVFFNRFRESIYGPTKMTQSVMSISNNFRKVDNPSASSRLSGESNVIYASGQVFNIAELVRQRIDQDKAYARLKEEGMLPQQSIARNVERYKVMQAALNP